VIDHLPFGERCRVVEAQEAWLPIGYPWKLLEANLFLLSRSQPSPPQLPGVEIRPPVLIGTGSQIEAGCRLGPGVTIGADCRIVGESTIVNSLVMDGVTIDSGCTIKETIIGTGAIVGRDVETQTELSGGGRVYSTVKGRPVDTERVRLGATIGHHARLGAGSRTMPGVKIWPGITVEPGEVVQADLFKV
jgi:NDP-sugar pyrophosphorylase family protein